MAKWQHLRASEDAKQLAKRWDETVELIGLDWKIIEEHARSLLPEEVRAYFKINTPGSPPDYSDLASEIDNFQVTEGDLKQLASERPDAGLNGKTGYLEVPDALRIQVFFEAGPGPSGVAACYQIDPLYPMYPRPKSMSLEEVLDDARKYHELSSWSPIHGLPY
jgi:hypothetical protein